MVSWDVVYAGAGVVIASRDVLSGSVRAASLDGSNESMTGVVSKVKSIKVVVARWGVSGVCLS